MPEGVVADRPFAVAYRVRNRRKRLRSWALTITEIPVNDRLARFPALFIDCLPPGQEQRLETIGRCPRRARLSLDRHPRRHARFPFGLFACTAEFRLGGRADRLPGHGTAPPRSLADHRASASRSRPGRLAIARTRRSSSASASIAKATTIRWIHWRRSAHTGELVVREMIPLRQTRLVIMLDPWPASTAKGPQPTQAQRIRRPAPNDSSARRRRPSATVWNKATGSA